MVSKKAMREYYLDELNRLGVRATKDGVSIDKCDIDELHYELVLASFREVDTAKAENAWF
ncbi:hypothetical protein V7112_08685 [Bacillus sp. JJ1566]|uniref:hypothetical protein n=1 Tax=Bacillus sp. JJ1566 TaxID=3122961 RepID=UPI00300062AC